MTSSHLSRNEPTPGPWSVDVHKNIVASGGLVAFPGIRAGFNQEANARLIAAAPELLAALQRILAHPNFRPCECGASNCATTEARAAIAKATGGAS